MNFCLQQNPFVDKGDLYLYGALTDWHLKEEAKLNYDERMGCYETSLLLKQGYYNYMRGLIISQTNMNQAEKFFRNAIDLGLNMDHDLAMAKLNLSGILFTKRRKVEAQKLLKEAQELDKQGILKEQIKMMKNQMKRGNMPNQHYNRGGFRGR